MLDFIQTEVNSKKLLIGLEDRKILGEQEKLKELKEIVEKQTEDYLLKQRQIATFLECKKTFFGRVKYYFSNRKKEFQNANKYRNQKQESKKEPVKEEKLKLKETSQIYNIEDLIEICTKLDSRRKMVKNLNQDIKALELKKINLERKIKNANIYLNEIELHKKSIFEFWKFTNKDELPSLNEGEQEQNSDKEKIEKIFDYETNIENVGKTIDELQRRKLSKNETDGIFAIKQVLKSFKILNSTKSTELTDNQIEILTTQLENLKREYENNIDSIKTKDFDIFGAIADDNTKIKILNNQKHRETEKNKYNILNITPQTELSTYIDNIRNYLNLINEALLKISSSYLMPIYLASNEEIDLNNLAIFHLDQNKVIEDCKKEESINLYKINWKEQMPIVYYSNIIFYDNFNRTLPLGMNLSDEVLVNINNCTLNEKSRETFKINYLLDEYSNKIITVNVIEYDAKNKE